MSKLLAGLNPEQQAVVLATTGPVLVLAGAGSGKTRALTHRLAYLVASGTANPEELLAVTFTNKAAREMALRVASLLPATGGTLPTLGTFHSVGARILREQHQHLTRSAGFTILDTADSTQLVRHALEEQGFSTRQWNPKVLRQAISRAKNALQTPETLATSAQSAAEEIVATTYTRYEALLRQNDAYDFDDLIGEVIALLMREADVRAHYHARWRWLSVDEYQDTNPAQEQLLHLLLGPERNLCVVGDDYQAIYSWRGARVDHILRFEHTFPDATTLYLTQNYRSTPAILQAANQVIAENEVQKHKELWTERSGGGPVRVIALPSDRAEAAIVRQQVQAHIAAGGRAADCAILYRTNAQSRLLEEQFLIHELPYTIVGGFRFYDRQEVKDATALLQLYVNPSAGVALARLTRTLLPGIGVKTLRRWQAAAAAQNSPLLTWLASSTELSARQRAAVTPLLRALTTARAEQWATVAALLRHLVQASGYESHLKAEPDGAERWENIEELYTVAEAHTDPAAFIEAVALLSSSEELGEVPTDRVLCLTLHAAKGLEFPCVWLVGCEEGLLPHRSSADLPAGLEEERRLLYVGMTRAREQLTLTYAAERALHGELTVQLPSRFLQSLPDVSAEAPPAGGAQAEALPASHSLGDGWAQPGLPAEALAKAGEPDVVVAAVGEFISHPQWGRGVVIATSGSLLTGVFPNYGVKTFDGGAVPAPW